MPHVDEGLLHAYLDGELSPVERARVDEHLAGCLGCRTRLDEERQLIERSTKLLAAALPPDRMAPPFSALARPHPRRFWHVRMPLAWAATIILAIGLGWKLSDTNWGTPRTETLSGPIAVRESQAPPAQQPAAPTGTTSGRLDIRRQRSDKPAPPTLAQKSAARHDTAFTDELRSVTPAEERDAAGAGSVAAPAPIPTAPAANAATRNPELRLQAVTVGAAPAPLDSAAVRAILGREPLVIPGLAVRSITRSGRVPNEIVVTQALDSTHVVLLFEARQTMTQAFRDRGTAAADARAPTAVAKAIARDTLAGRLIGDVMVEIQAGLTADSLKKLLAKIKP